MKLHRRTFMALALATGLCAPQVASADDGTIKIGVLATFQGAFTVLGEDSLRGAMTAVD
ncbi:MAG: ABC transporter substrate-binding protein, partial [Rhizobiaceae bacterium]